MHVFQVDQELRKYRAVPPEEAAEITDCRMTLLYIPFGFRPPTLRLPALIQTELQQAQQRERQQLHLEGAQHGLLRPGAALLHPEALLVVAKAVFLMETQKWGMTQRWGTEVPQGADGPSLHCPAGIWGPRVWIPQAMTPCARVN